MRCNYECINTIGSYKCVDAGIGADQPFIKDFSDDYEAKDDSNDYKVGSDDTDGNYDIIEGVSVVSECLNGFYFNETVGDCRGKFSFPSFLLLSSSSSSSRCGIIIIQFRMKWDICEGNNKQ